MLVTSYLHTQVVSVIYSSTTLFLNRAVSVATGYGLEDRKVKFESLWSQEFSLLRNIQDDSGDHLAPYAIVYKGFFPEG
jgi:hypothetical protein